MIIGGYLKFRLSKSSNFQPRLANNIENRLAVITASRSLFFIISNLFTLAPSGGTKLRLLFASREVSLRIFLDEEVKFSIGSAGEMRTKAGLRNKRKC